MFLRHPGLRQAVETLGAPQLAQAINTRRALPPMIRDLVIVFPGGEIVTRAQSDITLPDSNALRNLPQWVLISEIIDGEKYTLYSFSLWDRRIIFYEDENLLSGAVANLLESLVIGIVLFSIAIFLIAVRLARSIIEPIEAVARREKAYARHIAHELKTPLAVMKWEIELAQKIPEESHERLRSAVEEITDMQSIVDDLMRLSASQESLSTQSVEIVWLFRSYITKYSPEQHWDITSSDPAIMVTCDPRLLEILFKNLIINTMVHSSDQRASAHFTQQGAMLSNRSEKLEKSLVKNGFDPFVGTPGKGSGIGLSLVKRICEIHSWRVALHTKKGMFEVEVKWK